jgi:plasmid stability protein
MPAITLKNLPASLHAQLKQRARQHHRSLTGEVIAVLHEAVEKEASSQSDASAQRRLPNRRRPLPTFGGGGQVPPDFDLIAAIRKDTAKGDEALVRRLLEQPDDSAGH